MDNRVHIRTVPSVAIFFGAVVCLPAIAARAPLAPATPQPQSLARTPGAEVALGLKLAAARKAADTTRAMALFRKAYAQGDPDGAWYLGNAYDSIGLGVTPDLAKAKHWMRLGINGSGNRMVSYALQLPVLDRGTGQNGYAAEVRWLRKAAKSGSTVGMVLLAQDEEATRKTSAPREIPPDPVDAKRWMQRAARAGNIDAQVLLGDGMIRGEFGPPDVETGLRWLRKAANRGSGQAAGLTALYLLTGDYGVPKNFHEGLKWAILAAQRHNAFGYALLGDMEEQGIGGKRDPATALYLLAEAQHVDTAHSLHGLSSRISAAEAALPHAQVARILAKASEVSIPKFGDSVEVVVRTVPPGWAQ